MITKKISNFLLFFLIGSLVAPLNVFATSVKNSHDPTAVEASFNPDPGDGFIPATFPSGFKFGTANAAWQVEGNCRLQQVDSNNHVVCVDSSGDGEIKADDMVKSNWYNFQEYGGIVTGEENDIGNGFFALYDKDFAGLAMLGLNSVRLSIDWARVQPRMPSHTDPGLDPVQIGHYIQMLQSARAHGLEPVVTFYHWNLPEWVQYGTPTGSDMLSSTNTIMFNGQPVPEFAYYFANFVSVMAAQIGSLVDYYAVMNEPLEVALAYGSGEHPPGITGDVVKTLQAHTNLAAAHLAADAVLRNLDIIDADGDGAPVKIGIAQSVNLFEPLPPDDELVFPFRHIFSLPDDPVKDAILNDALNELAVYQFLDAINHTLDFVGVNHYSTFYSVSAPCEIMFDPTHPLYALIFPIDFPESCAVTSIRPPLVQPLPYCSPANGWSSWLNAENFKTTLKKIGDRYNKPILITESGIGESSLICGELPDCINRAKFLLEYIYVMGELIDEGYNIIGYLHWSDADNFEWSNGTNWRFGLNLVDFNDPKMPRIPSSGVPVYREIATNSKITRDTWAAYDQQLYSTDPRDLNTYDPLNPSNEWNVLGTTGYIRDSRWCSEASPEINGITASFVKLRVDSERIFRVDVDVDVSDHCDPAVNCKIKKITSKKDLEVTFNSALSADMGRKPGKYSIEIECLDVHGNEASRDFSLICSKNKKGILTCKQKKPKNRSFK